MSKSLMILGAGGHARVVYDIAKSLRYETIQFLDDFSQEQCVVGKIQDFSLFTETHDFIVAIGNNATRKKIYDLISASDAKIASLIHPSAILGSAVEIGAGTVIMPGAVVNNGAKIGAGVIINTCASVDHDCCIGDFSHISVGARVAGTVKIGNNSFIGAGAIIINNVSLCDDVTLGAGAVVVKNIETEGTYVGVPAKKVH